MFQTIKMQLYYERNSDTRSHHWKRTSQNGTGKNQSHQEIEDTNKSQGCRKFSGTCKLLPEIYPEFQSYSKTMK